jgi:hypothetical protein
MERRCVMRTCSLTKESDTVFSSCSLLVSSNNNPSFQRQLQN